MSMSKFMNRKLGTLTSINELNNLQFAIIFKEEDIKLC